MGHRASVSAVNDSTIRSSIAIVSSNLAITHELVRDVQNQLASTVSSAASNSALVSANLSQVNSRLQSTATTVSDLAAAQQSHLVETTSLQSRVTASESRIIAAESVQASNRVGVSASVHPNPFLFDRFLSNLSSDSLPSRCPFFLSVAKTHQRDTVYHVR